MEAQAPSPPMPAGPPLGATGATGAEGVKDTMNKVNNMVVGGLEKLVGPGNGLMVLLLVGVVILAFVLGIVLYYFITRSIAASKTYIIPKTDTTPTLCTKVTEFSGKDIPKADNGKRTTVSWWMYINDLNEGRGRIRRIFNRGTKMGGIADSGPFVCLNDSVNKVHIIFRTTDSSQYMLGGVDQSNTTTVPGFATANEAQKTAFLSSVHGITIDYIPMQRWVHVAVVVNEESSGGIVMAYLDGELVKTVTSSTTLPDVTFGVGATTTTISNVKLEIQSLDLGMQGDVYTGGDATTAYPGFSGLVSQIGFTNSDLNADDIYRMYLQGPIGGNVMTKAGLPPYGVRSPVYRIG